MRAATIRPIVPKQVAAKVSGPRRSGGIGRRASLRGWCPTGRGGSSPPSDTAFRGSRGQRPTFYGSEWCPGIGSPTHVLGGVVLYPLRHDPDAPNPRELPVSAAAALG